MTITKPTATAKPTSQLADSIRDTQNSMMNQSKSVFQPSQKANVTSTSSNTDTATAENPVYEVAMQIASLTISQHVQAQPYASQYGLHPLYNEFLEHSVSIGRLVTMAQHAPTNIEFFTYMQEAYQEVQVMKYFVEIFEDNNLFDTDYISYVKELLEHESKILWAITKKKGERNEQ